MQRQIAHFVLAKVTKQERGRERGEGGGGKGFDVKLCFKNRDYMRRTSLNACHMFASPRAVGLCNSTENIARAT